MSNDLDPRSPLLKGTVVATLVAAVTCALASDALASRLPADRCTGEQELSARVAAVVAHVRLVNPALVRDLPPEKKIAQWRN
jgi:hypothetical protein